MEILEAQAALAEAKLKLQLARTKKAKQSTTSGLSSAASHVQPPLDVPAPQPELTAPITQNNDPEQNRPAELPISENPWWFRMWTPKDARDPDRRDAEPRPRDLPPRDGHHAPEHDDRDLPPRESPTGIRTMTQPLVDICAGVGSLYSPDSTASRHPGKSPVANKFIDLDTLPRSRVPKERTEANDTRPRMTMPPVLPGPFEHHREEPDDVPRTP